MVGDCGEEKLSRVETIVGEKGLWLAVAGAALIFAVTAVLSTVLLRDLTDRLLTHDGAVKQEFLKALLAAEPDANTLFAAPSPSPALVSFSASIKSLPGLVRANVYSPDGFIRSSTDANLVGLQFGENEELSEAFTGQIASSLEDAESVGKSEHLALNQMTGDKLIEAYIPVTGPDGAVIAVVEFYQRDRWVEDVLAATRLRLWLAGAASALILAGAVLMARRWSRRS